MNKVVVLHIGQSKTGTTAIQRFFWSHREELSSNGYHYLTTGVTFGDSPAHYGLLSDYFHLPYPNPNAFRANQYHRLDTVWAAAIKEIESAPPGVIVLSCEVGWQLDAGARWYLAAMLRSYPVFVVIILRAPKSYMISSYKQALKVGEYLGTFENFVQARKRLLDYEVLVDRWGDTFGRPCVGVFSYEHLRATLIERFCSIIGMEHEVFEPLASKSPQEWNANVTPPDSRLAVIQILHRIERGLPGFAARSVRRVRRHLSGSRSSWLTHLTGRLPLRVISSRDLDALDQLSKETTLCFDTPPEFASRLNRALGTQVNRSDEGHQGSLCRRTCLDGENA